MMASLYSGVSGLKNHQVKLNVIGNNIANINTIGFKPSRVNFQEALVQTYRGAGRPSSMKGGTNPVQLGLGMQVAAIDTLFKQGGMETTGQITDLAIQGSGFFVLGDGSDKRVYTRAGALGFDSNSDMVDPGSGLYLLGKMADNSGTIPSLATIGKITLPFGQQDPANPTSSISLANNLDSSATDSTASLVSSGSSNVQTAAGTALDGVGGVHTISVTGNQALNASFTSTVGGMTLATTLNSLGVTIFDDFALSIDGESAVNVTGLNALSTVEDLINAISQLEHVTAELTGGDVKITRDKAGDPTGYNFVSSAASDDGVDANIVASVFGIADTGTPATDVFTSAGGAATTFVISDSFTPDQGNGIAAGPVVTPLGLVIDEYTGLVTGVSGIGGAGVDVTTGTGGLAATTPGNELVIQTEPTTHTMSMSVFDSQGGKHTISIEFFKSIVDNRWEWEVEML
ncbi:MAG: flagellar hook-basal body complex protein, partial [candidate division Zixibacteria bacterium]|nr:flagellar hook-basal body complex protein [candidate division Zixibacteria bacterium]